MKAMRLFWVHGYKATSIQDLVDGMGIGRGSLYGTFGGKRSLFMRALRHYDQGPRGLFEKAVDVETPAPGGAEPIRVRRRTQCWIKVPGMAVFWSTLPSSCRPHDAEIGSMVADGFTDAEGFFRTMIEKGQASKEISASVETRLPRRIPSTPCCWERWCWPAAVPTTVLLQLHHQAGQRVGTGVRRSGFVRPCPTRPQVPSKVERSDRRRHGFRNARPSPGRHPRTSSSGKSSKEV